MSLPSTQSAAIEVGSKVGIAARFAPMIHQDREIGVRDHAIASRVALGESTRLVIVLLVDNVVRPINISVQVVIRREEVVQLQAVLSEEHAGVNAAVIHVLG